MTKIVNEKIINTSDEIVIVWLINPLVKFKKSTDSFEIKDDEVFCEKKGNFCDRYLNINFSDKDVSIVSTNLHWK
tara:strand:+ start:32 stop:256 length:225 start_codon:yes stop_codon:yes gene_type:complete